jgi:hypothetical protein
MTSDLSVVSGEWQVASKGASGCELREVARRAVGIDAHTRVKGACFNSDGVADPSEPTRPHRRGHFRKRFPIFPGVSTYFHLFPDNGGKNVSAGAKYNREPGERCEQSQIRGKKMTNQRHKLLAFTTLGMRSPDFDRKPTGKNVRLLFAFCSLNFYIFFVEAGGAAPRAVKLFTHGQRLQAAMTSTNLDCGGTTPLSDGETCLPVSKRGRVRALQIESGNRRDRKDSGQVRSGFARHRPLKKARKSAIARIRSIFGGPAQASSNTTQAPRNGTRGNEQY